MELDAAGDELSRARRESQRLAIAISDHDRRFALENEPTPGWEPPTAEAKVLYLRGLALSETALGGPSDTVKLDLANALKKMAPEEIVAS
jgi:hypothetical protein